MPSFGLCLSCRHAERRIGVCRSATMSSREEGCSSMQVESPSKRIEIPFMSRAGAQREGDVSFGNELGSSRSRQAETSQTRAHARRLNAR